MTELEAYLRKNLPGVEDCGEKDLRIVEFETLTRLALSPSFDLKVPNIPPLEGLKPAPMTEVWDLVEQFYTENGYVIEKGIFGLIAKKDGFWKGITITTISQDRVRFSVESMGEE
ncbi:MAG: hypothetical protein WCO66_00955 [Candidatus Absconditabacteria bacterium]